MKKQYSLLIIATLFSISLMGQSTATFENLPLQPDTFWNGIEEPLGTMFYSGSCEFKNYYDTSFGGYWASGWAYSNILDSTTAGFSNLYGAITGTDFSGNGIYAVGQQGAEIKLDSLQPSNGNIQTFSSIKITNSSFAYLSMLNGDAFAKKFGGPSGNDPDFFKLVINGYKNGAPLADSVEFFLADFRDSDNSKDYIVNQWEDVDLTPLFGAEYLTFTLKSSDVGAFGYNTPLFFCIDEVKTSLSQTISQDDEGNKPLSVFPNPFYEKVNLSNLEINSNILLIDMVGQIVFSKRVYGETEVLNLSKIPSGIYFLKNGERMTRIVKK